LFRPGKRKARVSSIKVSSIKVIIEKLENLLYKLIDTKEMERDIKEFGDENVNTLLDSLKEITLKMDNPYARDRVYKLGITALWISYFDDAYKDCFYNYILSIINKGLNEEILVRDPARWHLNRFYNKHK